jgi:hypothetical protein
MKERVQGNMCVWAGAFTYTYYGLLLLDAILYTYLYTERKERERKRNEEGEKKERRNVGEKRVIGQEGGDEKSQECHIV